MSRKSSRSLATRLSRAITNRVTLVFIIAILAVGVISILAINRESRLNARRALTNSILEVNGVLLNVASTAQSSAWMFENVQGNDAAVFSIEKEMVQSNSHIIGCVMAYAPEMNNGKYQVQATIIDSETGDIDATDLSDSDYDYIHEDWYLIPQLLGKPHWNDPTYEGNESSRIISCYSVPLYNKAGEFFGVLRVDIPLDWLTEVTDKFKPYPSAMTLIAGHNSTFIAHPYQEYVMNYTIFSDLFPDTTPEEIDRRMKVAGGQTGDAFIKVLGKWVFATYAPFENGWHAIGICSPLDFYDTALRINVILLFIALAGLFLLYYSSKKTISRGIQPVTELTYAAMTMSRGNFQATIPSVQTNDELKKLKDSMNYLQTTITHYIGELKETTSTKERIQSELDVASAIQAGMLFTDFNVGDGVDLHAFLSPAKEVGGDLYYFFRDGNKLHFAVGDVSGKGVPAALFMAITTTSFSLLRSEENNTAGTMFKINNTFSQSNETGMFVTLFYGVIDLDTMVMEFCNGGHNPIVITDPDGTARFLKAKSNIAVGLFPDFNYESETVHLQKGSRIMVYTDGVSEAEDREKNQFGEDRLIEYLSNIPKEKSSKEVVDGLYAAIQSFTNGNEQNDDITIMSIGL